MLPGRRTGVLLSACTRHAGTTTTAGEFQMAAAVEPELQRIRGRGGVEVPDLQPARAAANRSWLIQGWIKCYVHICTKSQKYLNFWG
jgi:hypothetical protein